MQALDIHAYAMPLPVLQWLADQGLADTSAVEEGIIRLDPKISGVGLNVPLPLARSQHDVATRLIEMDAARDSHPPCHYHPSCSPVRPMTGTWSPRWCGGPMTRPTTSRVLPIGCWGLGHVGLGWPGAVSEAQRCVDELGMAGLAIGTRGRGHDLDSAVNEEFWEFVDTRRIFVFIHPSGVPDGPRQREY